jgi:hypothetical protein
VDVQSYTNGGSISGNVVHKLTNNMNIYIYVTKYELQYSTIQYAIYIHFWYRVPLLNDHVSQNSNY